MVPDTSSLWLRRGGRHDDEASFGIAGGLEGSVQEMMCSEGAESGIHMVDVGERVDGEPRLAKQSWTVGALQLGRQNPSRQRAARLGQP